MTKDEWLDIELNYGPLDTINATIEDDSRSYIVKFSTNTEIKILDNNLESVKTF